MLVIRPEQLHALRLPRRQQFILEMAAHLRRHFPVRIAPDSDDILFARIDAALLRAASFELSSRQDLSRFLNLAAFLGWDFLDLPENAWMSSRLSGPPADSPSARLLDLQNQILFQAASRAALDAEAARNR